LVALLRFNRDLQENQIRIQNNTPFGNTAFSTDRFFSSRSVLQNHQDRLPSIFTACSPDTIKAAVAELTAFVQKGREPDLLNLNRGNLPTGIASLGAAITTNQNFSIKEISPDAFYRLREAIRLIRECRDTASCAAVWIDRQEALTERTQPIKVYGQILEDGEVVRTYNGEAYNRERHNTDQLRFQTQRIDELGEPTRELAADVLTAIVGKHPWTAEMALGQPVEFSFIDAERAKIAAAAVAQNAVRPVVIVQAAMPAVQILPQPVETASATARDGQGEQRRGFLSASFDLLRKMGKRTWSGAKPTFPSPIT
jgi:hypothetical protein